MHPRRGFTLIEMIVVITVGSVLMAVGTGILCLLLKSERLARDDFHAGTSVARLAEQFRQDAHAAVRAPRNLDPDSCRFQLPRQRRVVYLFKPGMVSRTEWAGNEVLVRQECYDLPAAVQARAEASADAPPAAVCLLLEQPGGGPLRVEAAVGRDLRFTKKSPRSEK
jgi:prepilin-type N-terminal cleavage/methylation domain-containing protein